MAWGDYGKSTRLRLTNGIQSINVASTPVSIPIQQSGILENLRILTKGTATVTLGGGTIAVDKLGPWNQYQNVSLNPNAGTPIVQLSGVGLYHVKLARSIEYQPGTPDTAIVTESNAEALSDAYNTPTTTGTYRNWLEIPITQNVRSLGGKVGWWLLQNPAVQLALNLTPNFTGTATPFNVQSTTAGTAPYLATGAATVTLGNPPTVEVHRNLWQVPANDADFPPFQFVSTWFEDYPQGVNVNSANSFQWIAPALAGLLVRLGVFMYDGATNNGIAMSSLTNSNSLSITTDNETPKFQESGEQAQARQQEYYGFLLPQGLYFYDFMGQDLTLQDTLSTDTTANIKFKANLSSALGSTNSFVKIYRQLIQPMQIQMR